MSGSDPPVRLFFAAVPDAATGERIQGVAAAGRWAPTSRLVPRNNYHLTVAFVGAVPTSQLPMLRQIGATLRAASFTLRFDAYEYWPKPEVLVASARTIPPALGHLWEELHRELATHGWALDRKRLRPHVTLAKKIPQQPALPAMSAFDWMVNEICLMRSDTSADHPAYTVVATWRLLDKREDT
jgi:2'-5' RNA ligase